MCLDPDKFLFTSKGEYAYMRMGK